MSSVDHSLRSIGTHTQRFAGAAARLQSELAETLKTMAGLDYVRAGGVAGIPVMRRETRFIVYGPLREFPLSPEVVFSSAHTRQERYSVRPLRGLTAPCPTPWAVPHAPWFRSWSTTAPPMSLGCCRTRAYMDAIPDDTTRWALAGNLLEEYGDANARLSQANQTRPRFHEIRNKDVSSGSRPTLRECLE